jgi:hypothetical protein
MSAMGDWYRFNGFVWFLETDHVAANIQSRLKPLMAENDNVVIVRLDLSDYHGWASQDVWNWLGSKKDLAGALSAIGLFRPNAR